MSQAAVSLKSYFMPNMVSVSCLHKCAPRAAESVIGVLRSADSSSEPSKASPSLATRLRQASWHWSNERLTINAAA